MRKPYQVWIDDMHVFAEAVAYCSSVASAFFHRSGAAWYLSLRKTLSSKDLGCIAPTCQADSPALHCPAGRSVLHCRAGSSGSRGWIPVVQTLSAGGRAKAYEGSLSTLCTSRENKRIWECRTGLDSADTGVQPTACECQWQTGNIGK